MNAANCQRVDKQNAKDNPEVIDVSFEDLTLETILTRLINK